MSWDIMYPCKGSDNAILLLSKYIPFICLYIFIKKKCKTLAQIRNNIVSLWK